MLGFYKDKFYPNPNINLQSFFSKCGYTISFDSTSGEPLIVFLMMITFLPNWLGIFDGILIGDFVW